MTGAKQILLAGFAALCMVLPACRSTAEPESAEAPLLVVSNLPLSSASYTAEYTQDGALPFTCEVKLGTDGRIRRDYVWKDEKDAEKKVSIVINGKESGKLEDGRASVIGDSDTAQARFFAGLILDPGSVVSSAQKKKESGTHSDSESVVPCRVYTIELSGVPGMGSCVVETDPKSDLWSALIVHMNDNSGTAFSTRFHNYKSESGVTYPSLIVSSTEDGAPVRCVIRDVKINPELPDELFRLPDTNG